MKKLVFIVICALVLLTTVSCISEDEPTVTPCTTEAEGTQEVTTEADTTAVENTAEETTAEETTVPSTTAIENGWESVIYEENGVEVIMGSSTLYGDPTDTTFTYVSHDSEEIGEAIEDIMIEKPEPLETDDTRDTEYVYDTTPPEEGKYYPTVLMYHCVHDEPYTENTALFVRPSELESHLQALVDNDIQCLFADEFGPVDKNSVIMTFDDGYEDNYTYMFPLIKKYNIKVTVYMIAYKIDKPGYLTAEQIKEMSDSGLVQFGSHTLDHPSLTSLGEEGIRQQLEGSSWIISEVTGKPVTTLAYPSGRYNETVMSIASEIYDFAFTTDDDRYVGQDRMMLPRYAILRGCTREGFLRFVK